MVLQRLGLIVLVLGVLPLDAENQRYPPSEYQLDEVTIHLSRSSGGRNATYFEISGTGTGLIRHIGYQSRLVLSEDDESRFLVPGEEIINLINAFHEAYFFSFEEVYGNPNTVALEDDGVVHTFSIADLPSPGTTVAIEIGDFQKSCSYGRQGPIDLEALAQRIESLARRLQQAGRPAPESK